MKESFLRKLNHKGRVRKDPAFLLCLLGLILITYIPAVSLLFPSLLM